MANPLSALRQIEAARRRRLREPSREPSFLQHAVATRLPPMGQEWRIANPRKQRGFGKRRNVPAERHTANVEKVTNYWNVLRPWHGRRTTVDHVGRASAFQRVDTIARDQNFTANGRGQPTEAESGCQRRPLCAPVTRTYQSSSIRQNTHTHTHTHTHTEERDLQHNRFLLRLGSGSFSFVNYVMVEEGGKMKAIAWTELFTESLILLLGILYMV